MQLTQADIELLRHLLDNADEAGDASIPNSTKEQDDAFDRLSKVGFVKGSRFGGASAGLFGRVTAAGVKALHDASFLGRMRGLFARVSEQVLSHVVIAAISAIVGWVVGWAGLLQKIIAF